MTNLKSGFGITALIAGIVSFLMSFIPLLNILGFFIAVVAVIFGLIAVFNASHKTVLGAVGSALGVLAIVIGVVVNVLFVGAVSESGKNIQTESSSAQESSSASSQASETSSLSSKSSETKEDKSSSKSSANESEKPKKSEKPKESKSSEKSEDDTTVSQKNALRSAETYLSFTGMSESGLEKQLIAEGYPKEDAKWAVKEVDADWNEQAVKSAETYLKVTSLSHKRLVEQLTYGGFTKKQAEYAASEVGL